MEKDSMPMMDLPKARKIELPAMTSNCIVVETYPQPDFWDIVIYDECCRERKNPIRIKINPDSDYSKILLTAVFQQYAENIFNRLKRKELR